MYDSVLGLSYLCLGVEKKTSSLAKGFAHGPLSLHPWQIALYFVISADRHLAVFTGLAYKVDITFDQCVLLTVSCLVRCKMTAPSVYIFDCIRLKFTILLEPSLVIITIYLVCLINAWE